MEKDTKTDILVRGGEIDTIISCVKNRHNHFPCFSLDRLDWMDRWMAEWKIDGSTGRVSTFCTRIDIFLFAISKW